MILNNDEKVIEFLASVILFFIENVRKKSNQRYLLYVSNFGFFQPQECTMLAIVYYIH